MIQSSKLKINSNTVFQLGITINFSNNLQSLNSPTRYHLVEVINYRLYNSVCCYSSGFYYL